MDEFLQLLTDWGNAIWEFFGNEDNRNRSTAIATVVGTLIALLLVAWAAITFLPKLLLTRAAKNKASAPVIPDGSQILTEATIDELLEARIAKRLTALEQVHGEEREILLAQIAELKRKESDPERALEEEREHIERTKESLARESNKIGAERLGAARKALEAGDYSVADELFAGIEAEEQIAVARAARAAFSRGEIAEAEVRWADAAGHYARAAGLVPEFWALKKAAQYAQLSGDYASSLQFGTEALALAREMDDPDALGGMLNDQAILLSSMGRYPETEPLYRQAIAIAEKTWDKSHPNYAAALNNLAGLLRATGRYDEAEPLYREAMEITGKTLGKDHPTYATRLNNLAGLLEATGRYGEAEPLFREAMEITGRTLGKDHPDYATRLNNLAVLYYHMERFDEALPLMQQALATREAKLGPEHPDTVSSRRSLEAMRAAAGKQGA